MLGEHVGEERPHRVPEDDRVGDLHHRRLQVQREEHALRLGVGDLLRRNASSAARAHHRAVDDLAREHREVRLQHRHRAVGGDVLDPQRVVGSASVTDCSVERKSPSLIVETCDLDSVDQAPIECGCLRA